MHELTTDHLEVSKLDPSLLDINKYSSYYKFINVTHSVLGFIKKVVLSFPSNVTAEIY